MSFQAIISKMKNLNSK